jgi:hypothetical protein
VACAETDAIQEDKMEAACNNLTRSVGVSGHNRPNCTGQRL